MATGIPFSSLPSLVITHTCLLLVSWPLPQTLSQGEYISCGGAGSAACCCAGAFGAAGAGAGAGFAAGLAAGAFGFAGACAITGMAMASNAAAAIETISARPSGRADATR